MHVIVPESHVATTRDCCLSQSSNVRGTVRQDNVGREIDRTTKHRTQVTKHPNAKDERRIARASHQYVRQLIVTSYDNRPSATTVQQSP